MALLRPRLTDYHNILLSQAEVDFAIPFLDEDVPLYVDPFLLWKSPSHMDRALHTSLVNSFNHLNWLIKRGRDAEAVENLVVASECDEVGLGVSASRRGKRIGDAAANDILAVFRTIPTYNSGGFVHFEELQLYVDGISRDRISDFACSYLKSFLIDYTCDQCEQLGLPMSPTVVSTVYDYGRNAFSRDVKVTLPVHPETNEPLIFTPKRWLRHVPWINYDDYFSKYCPRDDVVNKQGSDERVKVLTYNRENFGLVSQYVSAKERTQADCHVDPLFKQLPVISAKRKLAEIKKLPTGNANAADRQYEDSASQLLASLLYPHLDFADTQSRSDGGSTIRDLVFYNSRSADFLIDIHDLYQSRQIVMELKNVKAIEREHVHQLNRYLNNEFGAFGVLVTRNPLPKAMFRSTVELWSGQRRCIISLTDADLELMVTVFESKQRAAIDVLKKKYIEFRNACPQ